MLDIGVGSIITNGLGGPACNLLIFGPVHLYINPLPAVTPTPSPTSVTPTPSPSVPIPTPIPSGGGGGGGVVGPQPPPHPDDDDDDEQKFELTFVVHFRKRKIVRKYIVDSFKKDKIIKRVGQINTIGLKFKVIWDKVTNNRFTTRWKK